MTMTNEQIVSSVPFSTFILFALIFVAAAAANAGVVFTTLRNGHDCCNFAPMHTQFTQNSIVFDE